MFAGLDIFGWIALLSSSILRLSGYVFLRWIPGHHIPPIVYVATAIYFTAVIPARQFDPKRGNWTPSAEGQHAQPRTKSVFLPPPPVLRTWRTWLYWALGAPYPCHGKLQFVPMGVNVAVMLMVLDLTYFARHFHQAHDLTFTRVGHVSYDTARILVRDPSPLANLLSISYQATSGGSVVARSKTASAAKIPSEHNDHTTVFDLTGLKPAQRYEYAVSNNLTGSFTTLSRSASEPFTFLHSSCLIPNFPYRPFRHHLEVPGFKHLARRIPELRARFMLFLGDFIYIDVPHRFGVDKETYRREYRQVYASPDWASVTQQPGHEMPWLHVLDDHEIANDWDKNETGIYSAAADPWHHYQVSVNPKPVRQGASYFSFTQGPAAFFLIDTRRYRTPFDGTNGTWTAGRGKKSMLGGQQRQDLLKWLSRKEASEVKWKVVVSSIPFTKNWRFGSEDTWGGYLGERQVLLEAMWEASTAQGVGIVVLSGDRHEFAATAFPPPIAGTNANKWPAAATVHEFSASPLSMFYLPIRTYRQEDDEDVCLKYLPDGNSKFGALKITSSATTGQSVLDYRLFIDGEEAWTHTITTAGAAIKQKPEKVNSSSGPTGGLFSWFLRDQSKPHIIAG